MDETILFPLEVRSHDQVYEDRNQKITRVTALFPGFNKEFLVADFGERAAVLVVRDNKVLLSRQYRLLINDLSFEIPGGKIDENESPEEAAIRECLEETGIRVSNPTPLINYHAGLDATQNYTHIFLGKDISSTKDELHERRTWIPFDQCLEMVFHQKIMDCLTIIALLCYQVKLLNQGI